MVSNNTWPAGYCWNSETRGGGELGVGGLGGGERGDDELAVTNWAVVDESAADSAVVVWADVT